MGSVMQGGYRTRANAGALFLAVLIGAGVSARDAASQREQRPTFRSSVDVVSFAVTVTDRRGRFITDLQEHEVEIYEDGRKQALRFFVSGDAAGGSRAAGGSGDGVRTAAPPLHLGAVFDISGSMDEDLRFARSAAIKFLNILHEAEDYTIVDFDSEVRVARFSHQEFPRLVERLRSRKAEGRSAVWDAVGVYLDGAQQQDGRKVLVLYSDGGDNSSNLRFGELIDLLRASDVTVYVVGFLQHQRGSERFDQQMKLQQIADVTGGQAFFPLAMKDLDAAYEKVAREIAAQYSLGYLSSNQKADGTWRKVEVRVTRAGLSDAKLRSRQGYFAPLRNGAGGR